MEKNLMLGKIEVKRRKGKHTRRWLESITDQMDMKLTKFWEIVTPAMKLKDTPWKESYDEPR